jgi:anti-sigma B factor antagonist
MTAPLTLAVREGALPPVLAVDGEVDMANAGRFRDALGALAGRHAGVVVDLTAVRYLDSAGINVLYDHVDKLEALLVAPDGVITRALRIAGLGRLLRSAG